MEKIWIVWYFIQGLIGIHFFMPLLLYVMGLLKRKNQIKKAHSGQEADYAIIVTAYQQVNQLPAVVKSILQLNYSNYLIYIVADDCDITGLSFSNEKVQLLKPPEVLAGNVKSHFYAINRFRRNHERLTIIDSDNLVNPEYLNQLNVFFSAGYKAVQGVREAKNLTTTYACLDEAGDIYYRYIDRKLMFEAGSSAALSGSGMAFTTELYRECLGKSEISGAGFDKVLQYEILTHRHQIAFAERAIVYDEKTSRTGQLVNQRSRWINTWFKYFYLGLKMFSGAWTTFDLNRFLFSILLLRPPLFILFGLSLVAMVINIFIAPWQVLFWVLAFGIFFIFFMKALVHFKADARIYQSLISAPKFIYYQVLALFKAKKANKLSVATEHFHNESDKQP